MRALSIVDRDYATEEGVVGTTAPVTDRNVGQNRCVLGPLPWVLLFGSALFVIPGIGPLFAAGPLVAWIVGGAHGAGLFSIEFPRAVFFPTKRRSRPASSSSSPMARATRWRKAPNGSHASHALRGEGAQLLPVMLRYFKPSEGQEIASEVEFGHKRERKTLAETTRVPELD